MATPSLSSWLKHHGFSYGNLGGNVSGYTKNLSKTSYLIMQGAEKSGGSYIPDMTAPSSLDEKIFVGRYDDDFRGGEEPVTWAVTTLRTYLEVLDTIEGPPRGK